MIQTYRAITKAQVAGLMRGDGRIPDKDDVHEFKPASVILRARHIGARETTQFVMAMGMRPDPKGRRRVEVSRWIPS